MPHLLLAKPIVSRHKLLRAALYCGSNVQSIYTAKDNVVFPPQILKDTRGARSLHC